MSTPENSSEWFRLPTDVRPRHYDLTILSDLEALTFQGAVATELEIFNTTRQIQFNAGKGLTLGSVRVSLDGKQTSVAPYIDAEHERVTVQLDEPLQQGSHASILVPFRGVIDDSMMGYYKSTWEHEGKKGHYALTQFEPTSARRAFPCFDEPELKAKVTLHMLHRDGSTALGNMPADQTSSIDANGIAAALHTDLGVPAPDAPGAWLRTDFGTTPKMSTYIIAWANGHFCHLESEYHSSLTNKTIPLRVYTTPEYIHQAHYALQVKNLVLPVYEKLFDVAYPLPKLDTLVASDFDAGAMENWGLITGRTSVYLYDDKTGLQGKKVTASVQSHEVAHMWFGNIATLAWWDNLWLNEAFATLMGEVISLDHVYPEWNSASEFIVSHLGRALELDGKRSSHPIEIPLQGENVEDAVNQVFDAISYSKGASVLRMLSRLLGEDVFLKGVSIYLKKHLYANTVTKDLWDGISEASGKDINALMSNWILKQGFPVLTVSVEGDAIRVRQNRFLDTGDPTPGEDATLWQVPLALKTVQNGKPQTDFALMLDEREKVVPLPRAADAVWKLNAETIGVYRVAYAPEHLQRLGKAAAAQNSPLSLEDRVGLVSDAFTLAQAGYARTSGGLALMQELRGDKSSLVNQAAALNLQQLGSAWWEQPEGVRDAINAFRIDVFGPLARELTFDFGKDDAPELRELRSTVIGAAGAAGDPWTLAQVKERFAPLLDHDDDSRIDPDILRTVLSLAVRHGGANEYDVVMRVYNKPPTPRHKLAAMVAFGYTQDRALLQRTIDFVFSGKVKSQDFMYFFMSLAANPSSRRMLWETVKARFDELAARFEGNFSLSNLIKSSISSFSQEQDAKEVEAFFAARNTAKFSMSLAQGLDSIRAQARWLERDAQNVAAWLKAHGYERTE
ncbi:Aminopeptidase 2 mitochondrial [Malassezia vespertilionis]|uniref:Aminopeptidase n=1 Tax=Malassezia vespertilionis TaxID=2020962 RepID=A0A2N1J889_9BASI|nr:Aminopeptidase 2 mitochondrial [Malassezia vespertilionis]PKI82777.1 Ape2p [Malassezia vespertilionis]WFD08233.1 Aminopeptidase 2 mitochondrial [Malassezia vespertilionis]